MADRSADAGAGPLGLVSSVLAHPHRWLAGIGLVTAALAPGLLRLELRTDGAAIHPVHDPVVERTAVDRRTFHETDPIVLLATARPGGPALDSPAGLRYVWRLHGSLEDLTGIRAGRVRSLASLLDPRPGTPLLQVGAFLDRIPGEEREVRALRDRIHRSSLAEGLFLSAGGEAAALYLPVDPDRNRAQLVRTVERWADSERRATPGFDLRLTGPVTAEALLGRAVLDDLARLVPWMVAVIAVLLFFALRSVGGVAVCLTEVLLVLVWTLGAMGWCGVPVTLVTTVLPVILMTVAVTDEIHLLDRFRHHLAAGSPRVEALVAAVDEVGRPIVLTSLTTAVAFLSFLSASVAPVRHFGLFTSLGVVLAMALSFTLVPALARVLPGSWFRPPELRRGVRRGGLGRRELRHALPLSDRLVLRGRATGAGIGLLIVVLALPGLFRLSVQDSWIDNFDPGSPLPSAERDFNAHFWGSYRFDVVLASGKTGWFLRSEGLRLIERVTEVARAGPHVGGVISHLTAFELAARAVAEDGQVSDLPPVTLTELASILLQIEPRIDLDHYLDFDGSSARLRILVRSPDYAKGWELERYLRRELDRVLAAPALGGRIRYHFSGDLPVAGAVVHAIVTNMLRSVGWTVAGVALLLALALRSLRAAALALTPLLCGLPILLGALGYAGLPLGIATSMFLAVTIGVAVDFGLHFRHAWRRACRAGLDRGPALAAMMASAGRAVRWNAGVLACGLCVLALSDLKPNRSLGILLAAAIVTCYGTTLLLLPWLLERLEEHTMGKRSLTLPAAGTLRPTRPAPR